MNRADKKLLKLTKKIQALEGAKTSVDIESMLYAMRINSNIGGLTNEYKSYGSQVKEVYRKYKGEADWGNNQCRALVDLRTSFIAGEGLSISTGNIKLSNWIDKFLKKNRLNGSRFFDAVLGSELTGKILLNLKPEIAEVPSVVRIPYTESVPYDVRLSNKWDPQSIRDIVIKEKNAEERSLGVANFVYIRTAGADNDVNNTCTKVGLVLNECENYDRALKDIRRLNHVLARITPTFKTTSESETNKLQILLNKKKWKIGEAFIGTAEFDYKAPTTGAHDNLKAELSTSIKTMSSVTGCPVHWVGWTDLMANRSTAETLYDTLGNATVRERTLISEGFYDLIIKAQEMYIDTGGTEITSVDKNFQVTIPVVDFSRFLELVRGLSMAFNDGVISSADYQAMLPGIDQLQTEKVLREQAEQDTLNLINSTKEVEDGRTEDREGTADR